MKRIKDFLKLLDYICCMILPVSFVLMWVGMFTFNAKMLAYSFLITVITGGYTFFYWSFTSKDALGRN